MTIMTTNTQYYTDIANAIRTKENSENTYTPAEMAPRIQQLFNESGSGDGTTYNVVEQATPTISVNASGVITATSVQEEGLVASGTKTSNLAQNTYTGGTYTPKATSQTVNIQNKYATGNVIISGDSNLKSENILQGISIFGVNGSLSPKYYYTGYGTPSNSVGAAGDFYFDLGEE